MSTVYNWTIDSMTTYPQVANYQDVVFLVSFTCTGVNGDVSVPYSGSVNINLDPNEPFIPYDQLTENEVIGWVQTTLGPDAVATIEYNINTSINTILNSPVILPLPWSS